MEYLKKFRQQTELTQRQMAEALNTLYGYYRQMGNHFRKPNFEIVAIASIMLAITATIWLSYTIINQQKQIEKLEQQLQHEQMKYKIIINDPLVRDAMEAGG